MPDDAIITDGSDSSLEAQREVRLAKRRAFEERGISAHPERYETTHSAAAARALDDGTKSVRIAGRIMALRDMGKLTFAQLQDRSGRMQFAMKKDLLGDDYTFFTKHLDLGDHVGLEGEIFTTQKGEKTLQVSAITFLGKALLPLPEKWHGLTDKETRYRKRYLDLLTNEETRRVFDIRTKLVRAIRGFLDAARFDEVETPILQPTAGGAMAKPFMTHHNALDIDIALQIACETYMKRLVVGGYERVYQFARCFRNEGMDPSHLQEFTMLEYYAAYWNFEDNMRFTEELVVHALTEALGTTKITYQGAEIDFAAPWPRREFGAIIEEETGIDVHALKDVDALKAAAKKKGIKLELEKGVSLPNAIDHLYKKAVRPKLVQPQFLIHHPADLKPLARRNDADPTIADSFQLLVNGWEVVNAYSELVDPIEQRRAFETQSANKDAGDDEAMAAEEDYLEAMEHGMPPISGWGMGIDRFVALITNQENLRDVVFFPLMRPEGAAQMNTAQASTAAPAPAKPEEPEPKTRLAYLEDMQRLAFEAAVEDVRTLEDGRTAVVLDATFFYPQGGGQPFDTGTLTGGKKTWAVEDVRYADGEVLHIGMEAAPFAAGDVVQGTVDAERRALHTRVHAAGHVVDLALARLGADWKPGKGYHFPDGPYVEYAGTIDPARKETIAADIERACNELIQEDLPVTVAFLEGETFRGKPVREVRYGATGIRCGGTHVTRLGEIGGMTIRHAKAKGGVIRVGYDLA